MIDRETLHHLLTTARAALARDEAGALRAAGLRSGLAFLARPVLLALRDHPDRDEVIDVLRDLVGPERRKLLRPLLDGDLEGGLRDLAPDSPTGDACRALVEALASADDAQLGVQMRVEASRRGSVRNVRQVALGPGASYYEAGSQRAAQEQALSDYLRALQGDCTILQLGRLDEDEARHRRVMRLEQVYVGLNVERRVKQGDTESAVDAVRVARQEKDDRPLSALECLCDADAARRVLLLGAPGSGKSTFLNHLVLCLAGAALADRQQEGDPEAWLARLPSWSLGALLPVRIILRDFAAFRPLERAKAGSLTLLLDFLKQRMGAHAAALPLIKAALSAGRAVLLLDGFDEVVGDAVLSRVRACIEQASATYPHSPIIVTCRILDYQASPLRQLRGFQVETLAALNDDQITGFVRAWYAEYATSGRHTLGNPDALMQAIQGRPELRELARLPLLLTMMAIVHAGRGALPDARAQLYQECVELLLLRWRQEADGPDVLAQLGLPQFGRSDLLRLMARLGFAAHELAARDPAQADQATDLTRAHIQQILAETFRPYAPNDPVRLDGLVSLTLHSVATRNGLLLKRSGAGAEAYAFAHRSFQEFLAGYHLAGQADYDRLCLERSPHIHWHEALRLMAGSQALDQNQPGPPLLLAQELLRRTPLEQALAGELLLIVGRERAESYRPEHVAPGGLWEQACTALDKVMLRGKPPAAPAPLRARTGMALGLLRYGSCEGLARPEAAPPYPDRRLPLSLIGLPAPQTPHWRADLAAYWCALDPGPFWYGDEAKNQELQPVTLETPGAIGRHPVTNADFARFIAAGGYARQELWTEQGWTYIEPGGRRWTSDEPERITLPRYWSDSDVNNPLQPVVGVSWYEAAAYCRWLTIQGHSDGWLPAEEEIRLPTSLEWERAARHTDKRRYPWGRTKPDPERANYNDTEIAYTSPVGIFPRGAAECDALDLIGSVWEWTTTIWEQSEAILPEKDFTPDTTPMLRGGAYYSALERLYCGSRDWYSPNIRSDDWSFRVLWSPRST